MDIYTKTSDEDIINIVRTVPGESENMSEHKEILVDSNTMMDNYPDKMDRKVEEGQEAGENNTESFVIEDNSGNTVYEFQIILDDDKISQNGNSCVEIQDEKIESGTSETSDKIKNEISIKIKSEESTEIKKEKIDEISRGLTDVTDSMQAVDYQGTCGYEINTTEADEGEGQMYQNIELDTALTNLITAITDTPLSSPNPQQATRGRKRASADMEERDELLTNANDGRTKRIYTRRKGKKPLTPAERQKAYRQRHGMAHLMKERERKRNSYVPVHLRSAESLAQHRQYARTYKRELYQRKKLLKLVDDCTLNVVKLAPNDDSSEVPCRRVMNGERPAFSTTVPVPSTSKQRGNGGKLRGAATQTSKRNNLLLRRKSVDTDIESTGKTRQTRKQSNINYAEEDENASDTDCASSTSSNDSVNMNSRLPQSLSRKEWRSMKCRKGNSQNTDEAGKPQNAEERGIKGNMEAPHKLDLSGISYNELVKLRDACNYYIKQFEDKIKLDMLGGNLSLESQDVHNEENEMRVSSDTEDSGYSGQQRRGRKGAPVDNNNGDRLSDCAINGQDKRRAAVKKCIGGKQNVQVRSRQVNNRTNEKNSKQFGKKQTVQRGRKPNSSQQSTKQTVSVKSKPQRKVQSRTTKNNLLSTEIDTGQNVVIEGSQPNVTPCKSLGVDYLDYFTSVVKTEPEDTKSLGTEVSYYTDVSHNEGQTSSQTANGDTKSYRAKVQKAYRERQKAVNREHYLEKERQRSRRNYIPTSQLDQKTLQIRRERVKECNRNRRLRLKLNKTV